jgi:hypothetical protein
MNSQQFSPIVAQDSKLREQAYLAGTSMQDRIEGDSPLRQAGSATDSPTPRPVLDMTGTMNGLERVFQEPDQHLRRTVIHYRRTAQWSAIRII